MKVAHQFVSANGDWEEIIISMPIVQKKIVATTRHNSIMLVQPLVPPAQERERERERKRDRGREKIHKSERLGVDTQ